AAPAAHLPSYRARSPDVQEVAGAVARSLFGTAARSRSHRADSLTAPGGTTAAPGQLNQTGGRTRGRIRSRSHRAHLPDVRHPALGALARSLPASTARSTPAHSPIVIHTLPTVA